MSLKTRLKRLEKDRGNNRIWAFIGIGKPQNPQHQRRLEAQARDNFYADGGDRNAYLAFLPFDGMVSLYVISATFGLFQGGIVPSYAIIVREYFPAARAGMQTGTVIMATLLGMALGGWMSGAIFDLTGSYKAAFVNGIAWNLLNLSIALYFYRRARGMGQLR